MNKLKFTTAVKEWGQDSKAGVFSHTGCRSECFSPWFSPHDLLPPTLLSMLPLFLLPPFLSLRFEAFFNRESGEIEKGVKTQ